MSLPLKWRETLESWDKKINDDICLHKDVIERLGFRYLTGEILKLSHCFSYLKTCMIKKVMKSFGFSQIYSPNFQKSLFFIRANKTLTVTMCVP